MDLQIRSKVVISGRWKVRECLSCQNNAREIFRSREFQFRHFSTVFQDHRYRFPRKMRFK